MKVIDCFEVMGNSDTTEGRGPMIVVARFSNKPAAIAFVKSKAYSNWCVQGCQRESDVDRIIQCKLLILDNAEEHTEIKKDRIRQRALSKLTPEEREVLGL